MNIVEPIQRKMYPFKSSSPIVNDGHSDIEWELIEFRVRTNPSPRGESDSNDIDIAPARAAVTENEGMTTVDANDGDVNYWYQVAWEGVVAVTSTKKTLPGTRSFVKYMSVVTEPRCRRDNETVGFVGSADWDEIQLTGVRSVLTDNAALRDAGDSPINVADETSRRINDITPSQMDVTRSSSTSLQFEQQ